MTDVGPSEGDKAPDFCLPEASETEICLYRELEKGPVLLLFYPTDFGITCTLEFKRIMEMAGDLEAAGVRPFGISVNTTTSHRSWKEKMGMDIPLLSDPESRVVKLYDVTSPPGSLLKGHSGRAVFLVDPQGMIRYCWKASYPHEQPDYDTMLAKVRELHDGL
jgi:peroxiredoxin